MAKKEKQEECPSIPGWLVSFGDLMSLLLTFFILLYAMSSVDVTKAMKFLSYFQGEPQYKPQRLSIVPPIVPFTTNVVKKIRKRIKRILPVYGFQLATTTKYVMIRLFNDITFKDNSYTLTKKAKKALKEIAKTLKELPKNEKFHIQIAGHAFNVDNEPLPKGVKDLWDLSIKRAEAVAFYLMKEGVEKSKFFISGYGDTKPIYTWNNPLLLRRNNRVEIIIEVYKNIQQESKK